LRVHLQGSNTSATVVVGSSPSDFPGAGVHVANYPSHVAVGGLRVRRVIIWLAVQLATPVGRERLRVQGVHFEYGCGAIGLRKQQIPLRQDVVAGDDIGLHHCSAIVGSGIVLGLFRSRISVEGHCRKIAVPTP